MTDDNTGRMVISTRLHRGLATFVPHPHKAPVKREMRPDKRPSMSRTFFRQKTHPLHPIQDQATEYNVRNTVRRQILHQGKKAVAEIEERLAGVVFLQGGSAYVIDDAIGYITDPASGIEYPPAEVYLFQMREKIVVESAQMLKGRPPDEQTGARRPEYIAILPVLPPVFFDYGKNTSPAVRIP